MNETNSQSQETLALSQNYQKDPLAWCQALINQGLSGKYGDPAKMVAIIGRGHILGLDPYSALETIYTVNNQTALGVDIMLALVERSGLLHDKRHSYSGKDDTRTCTVWITRINRTEQSYSFSMAEAWKAELVKPGGGWKKFPDSMLYARAMSFALRREFPDVLRGVHSFEELFVEPSPPSPMGYNPDELPARPEKQPEGEEKPARQKRRRRTRAEMLAAKEQKKGKPLIEVFASEETSPPPASDEEIIDLDKAIPKEVTAHNELLSKAFNSSVSEEEVLGAAKALKLAFEETSLSQLSEDKLKRMSAHWPIVLGAISREKAKATKAPAYDE